jgi:D-alanine-D-alanine ligase
VSSKTKLKVLVLFTAGERIHPDYDLSSDLETDAWKTEGGVLQALRELGYTTEYLALFDDLELLRQKLASFQPDLVFNLADEFKKNRAFDQNIVAFLEMHGLAYTGCGSVGMVLCKHKGISKKILGYHHIGVPRFAIIPRGKRVARPKPLRFPILIKPLKEEASYGISQASFVETEEQFNERVQFVHTKHDNDVIAEEYIEGRELYVSILGNHRLQAFPIRELVFKEVPPDEPKIATYRAKWDAEYQKRWGLTNQFAEGFDPAVVRDIQHVCKRIYRLLTIDGYARIDLRVTPQNEVYFIEANPNPFLAADEDFAQSALKAGLSYRQLIERIVRLGLKAVRV